MDITSVVADWQEEADKVERQLEQIVARGERAGGLNVSCCTEVRAPKYQMLLAGLRDAYEELARLAGMGH